MYYTWLIIKDLCAPSKGRQRTKRKENDMILCIGEILCDMTGSVQSGKTVYEQNAGGAPFNVACAAAKFGAESAFVGCVGDDLMGTFLERFARAQGLKELYLRRDPRRNTTLAFVSLDEHGDRSFCFYRKNTADYHLPAVPEDLLGRAHIVHVGSLMLSERAGRLYAAELMRRAREAGKLVSFDVNFRSDIFRNTRAALKVYREIIALADIVKFSEDEVAIFGEDYVSGFPEKLVCVTFGKNGCEWRFGGKRHALPAIDVKPVDTTGAGDAFFAGVLSRLDGTSPAQWTAEKLDEAFAYGNVTGALNTLGHGAIEYLPSREEIARRL